MTETNFSVRPQKRTASLSAAQLQAQLNGRVIGPQDNDYDEMRSVFYGGIDRHPELIARPGNAEDVSKIVSYARVTGTPLAVRSGGHSIAGHGVVDGGIVIDLRDMHALDINPDNRTAWAETGLTAGEYTNAAAAHGLATGFGDTGSVGIGGITLGGGVGFLVRKYGMTIDQLLAAEIVTADGQILRTDAETHSDLFWAIRGGGGNFGVATRFQFRLHPVDKILGGILILPATPEVIASFIEEADAAPEELSTIANVMSAPPMPFIPAEYYGKMILMAMLVYAGPIDDGERVLKRFRSLATPIADLVRPMGYPEMFPPEDNSYHPTAVAHNMFVDRVDRDTARMILDTLQASDAAMRVAQLRVLGGVMGRVPVEETAYAHRNPRIMVNLAAFYTTPEEQQVRKTWVSDFAKALDQGYSGAYVNFMAEEGAARVRNAYPGSTWSRLAAIKARYDPTNLFRSNQNITPNHEVVD